MGQCRGYQKKGIMAKPIQGATTQLLHMVPSSTPSKLFSPTAIRRLKVNAAMFILNTIEQICTHPFAGQEQPRMPRQRRSESRWVLPALYGQAVVKNPLLPLGYQFFGDQELHLVFGADQRLQPAQLEACDLAHCTAPNGSRAVLFGCGYSFHHDCLTSQRRSTECCFLCTEGILKVVAAKATTARQAIFSPNANAGQQDPASDSEDKQGDVDPENVDNGVHQVEEMTDHQAQAHIDEMTDLIHNLPDVPLL